MTPDDFAARLCACGFQAKPYKGQRVYLSGYGRDVSAYLQLTDETLNDTLPQLAPTALCVTSSWKKGTVANAQRRKGLIQTIWKDLHRAGVIIEPPPDDWKKIALPDVSPPQRAIRAWTETAA